MSHLSSHRKHHVKVVICLTTRDVIMYSSGDAFSGDAFSGDAFSGDAFSDDAFSDVSDLVDQKSTLILQNKCTDDDK